MAVTPGWAVRVVCNPTGQHGRDKNLPPRPHVFWIWPPHELQCPVQRGALEFVRGGHPIFILNFFLSQLLSPFVADHIGSCDEALHTGTNGESNYRGCQNKTVSGLDCQNWRTQAPQRHNFGAANVLGPNRTSEYVAHTLLGADGDHNFCRNPYPTPTNNVASSSLIAPDPVSTTDEARVDISTQADIWCYTTDSTKRRENCAIQTEEESGR